MEQDKEGQNLTDTIERFTGKKFPEEIRSFFVSGEFKKYEGYGIYNPDSWNAAATRAITFSKPKPMLEEYKNYLEDFAPEETQSLLPVAKINGRYGRPFAAIELEKPGYPVYILDSGYVNDFAPTFQDFLKGLYPPEAETPFAKLVKAYKESNKFFKANNYQGAIDRLEKERNAFTDKVAVTKNEDYDILEKSLLLLGDTHLVLNNFNSAEEYYIRIMNERPSTSYYVNYRLYETYFRAESFEKLEAFLDTRLIHLKAEKRFGDWSFTKHVLAKAFLAQGRKEEAMAIYNAIKGASPDNFVKVIESIIADLKAEATGKLVHKDIINEVVNLLTQNFAETVQMSDSDLTTWWQAIPRKAQNELKKKIGHQGKVSLEAIQKAAALLRVGLFYLDLKDISFIDRFTIATDMTLNGNEIKKIPSIKPLTKLSKLSLDNNLLTDLKGIEQMPALEILKVKENKIKSVEALSLLSKLKELDISKNKVKDLTPLAPCGSLEELNVYDNAGIKGFEALAKISALKKVIISESSLKAVKGLNALRPDIAIVDEYGKRLVAQND
ncbi:hypothetical protein LVD17_00640 [Fulvivirga ulvae]|uniref:hypothetical protein n=1 Tax=Fulvivirga ulvae TaxID=2904245 RepID=UPI001F1F379D|nr:hypothetical protein [Fulvivirga ulvae]UII32345.1 hypothetical protein LVD17_00640 [Fulvivirga ulvae]